MIARDDGDDKIRDSEGGQVSLETKPLKSVIISEWRKKTLLTNQAIRYRLVQVFECYSSIVGPHSPVSLTYPSALNPLPLRRFCVNSVITRFHARSLAIDFRVLHTPP